ncbi:MULTISPECIES: hydroxypyruvate isomerase family protein [Halomonas]|uniref:hydroxypyruvate isomerase family protein n=1 Tax=Halomonas TaxID=2745 RepID=UPI001C98C425|nr:MULTISPECIES: TIM barrel protein [Halomonas]MBY6207527.1 TIM barrel protein [Halomonas sp. DP3Y7-2]MBY6228336.1 TIM barrel protein [Halomonas sp. DP3Y7-1]MCA0916401.1 TIM barrel protein [Halomonas denitrificans]
MLKFATNLTFMFTEKPFLERFSLARAAGFRRVEFHHPYPFCERLDDIRYAAREAGVEILHCNLPGGDWDSGERGIAVWPERRNEFADGVTTTLEIARVLGIHQLNCPLGYPRDDQATDEAQRTLIDNLRYAADTCAAQGVRLLVEPLNPITHPGYPLVTTRDGVALLGAVNHPNLKLQYDIYQMQRSEGELIETLRRHREHIGFVQLADNPGRGEPGTGEIHYPFLFRELEKMAFDKVISLEYTPSTTTQQSLGWLKDYGLSLDA